MNIRGKKNRLWLLLGLSAGLLGVGAVIVWNRVQASSSDPRPMERSFIGAVSSRDWGTLYDLSRSTGLASHGINRPQFARFVQVLTEGLPDDYFQDVTSEDVEFQLNEPDRGRHYLLLTFPNAPKTVEGDKAQHLIRSLRGRDGWTVSAEDQPMRFVKWTPSDPKARWQKIASAMEAAGLKEYPVTGRAKLVLTRINEFLNDKRKEESIATARTR